MNDNAYMQLALELAKKGCGHVSPNPMVGAVIVKTTKLSEVAIMNAMARHMLNEMPLPPAPNHRRVPLCM